MIDGGKLGPKTDKPYAFVRLDPFGRIIDRRHFIAYGGYGGERRAGWFTDGDWAADFDSLERHGYIEVREAVRLGLLSEGVGERLLPRDEQAEADAVSGEMVVEVSTTVTPEWLSDTPRIAVGRVPANGPTADRFIRVGDVSGNRWLLIELFGVSAFDIVQGEVVRWGPWLIVMAGDQVGWISLVGYSNIAWRQLQSYGMSVHQTSALLLVVSGRGIDAYGRDMRQRWSNQNLGLDGVIISDVDQEAGVIRGAGEWDPPGGWHDFAVSLESGDREP